MAKLLIGGQNLDIPPMNIKGIKKVWPVVQEVQQVTDPIAAIAGAMKVVAIAILASENPKFSGDDLEAKIDDLENRMLGTEVAKLRETMREILTESGLLNASAAQGEALGDAPMVPGSTETSIG